MKRKILDGKFTPCITNSWANSRVKIKLQGFETAYRSTWEAAFQILNPFCKYEKIRVPYMIENTEHNYIVDFVDEENKILFEIKPLFLRETRLNIIKYEAAKKWCTENNYQYEIISDEWFRENAKRINYAEYDEKLKKGMQQFLNEN